MKRARWVLSSAVIVLLASCAQVDTPETALERQAMPTFEAAIWADGELWATTAVTRIPPPNANNPQSFDALYVITNSNDPDGQLPVSEAAPGNPRYNGGRWFTHTATWTEAGFEAHGTVPVLESYDDVMLHHGLGHLEITPGSPEGPSAPPDYFECPLLPVRTG